MTIPTTIAIRELNRRLSLLEDCAQDTPQRLDGMAGEISALIGGISNELLLGVRRLTLVAPNDDALRTVEAAIYGYIADANPTIVFPLEHAATPA